MLLRTGKHVQTRDNEIKVGGRLYLPMKVTLKRVLVLIASLWVLLCLLLIQLLFGDRLFPKAQVVVSMHVGPCVGREEGGGPPHFACFFLIPLPSTCLVDQYTVSMYVCTLCLCVAALMRPAVV